MSTYHEKQEKRLNKAIGLIADDKISPDMMEVYINFVKDTYVTVMNEMLYYADSKIEEMFTLEREKVTVSLDRLRKRDITKKQKVYSIEILNECVKTLFEVSRTVLDKD